MIKRLYINVVGRVQKVSYRIYAVSQAESLDLVGFVQNEKDHSVTIVAEGEEESLKKLAEWAKQGPKMAYVKRMNLRWDKAVGEFNNFQIRYPKS